MVCHRLDYSVSKRVAFPHLKEHAPGVRVVLIARAFAFFQLMGVTKLVLDFVLFLVPLAFIYKSLDSFVEFLLAGSCYELVLQRPVNLLLE